MNKWDQALSSTHFALVLALVNVCCCVSQRASFTTAGSKLHQAIFTGFKNTHQDGRQY